MHLGVEQDLEHLALDTVFKGVTSPSRSDL